MIADLRRRLGRFGRRSDGVSAIEFAFVAPVLLLFIVGTMELGMILFADSLLEGGLREAARFVIAREA